MIDWSWPDQAKQYNELTQDLPVPLTQNGFFGDWHRLTDRPVQRLLGCSDGRPVLAAQVIGSDQILGWRFGMVPYGPVAKAWSPELIKELASIVSELAEREGYFFIRLDPWPVPSSEALAVWQEQFSDVPDFATTGSLFQSRLEWCLDLEQSEEDLFSSMHSKTRYHIRRAERERLEIEVVTEDLLRWEPELYRLLQETAERGGFANHSREYYRAVLEQGEEQESVAVMPVKHDRQIVGMLVLGLFYPTGYFLYSGFTRTGLDRRASYLARWQALTYLKQAGFTQASFGGVTKDADNGWSGFSNFKRRFGGYLVEHSPYFDYVHQPVLYRAYLARKWLR